jgi:hypothetical protein
VKLTPIKELGDAELLNEFAGIAQMTGSELALPPQYEIRYAAARKELLRRLSKANTCEQCRAIDEERQPTRPSIQTHVPNRKRESCCRGALEHRHARLSDDPIAMAPRIWAGRPAIRSSGRND